MSSDYVEQTTDLIGRVEGLELLPHAIRLLFFSTIAATAAWTDAHPDGHVHPEEAAFRLDRQVIRQLGWESR